MTFLTVSIKVVQGFSYVPVQNEEGFGPGILYSWEDLRYTWKMTHSAHAKTPSATTCAREAMAIH